MVVKIAKEGKVDDLGREFDMIREFYKKLEEGRKLHP